ncbi:MAG: cyclodeaminase/cyclohydrolase family protein [Caldilineaceae bacterium]
MQTGEMTIQSFLDALAARESTPGGGGAAAVTGAQAAALISMVINFTLGNEKYADVAAAMETYLAQSETLRQELVAMADRDVAAFTAVSACYGMPRTTTAEKAARTAALQTALKGATEVPFLAAEKCLDLLILAEPVGRLGNANVVSDAGTALYLAHAAIQSALINVNINLKFIKDDAYVAEWNAKRDALLDQTRQAYAAAKQACETTLGVTL